MSLIKFLPLFPLRLVVFPGEKLNLHIFEPRYRQLVHECQTEGLTFGINAFVSDTIMPFGTEMRLLKIEKHYENGEMDIRTEGVGLYDIEAYYKEAKGKLYDGADVRAITLTEGIVDFSVSKKILETVKEMFVLLNIQKELPETADEVNSYKLGHFVGFSIDQEYEMLCITSEIARQKFMLEHLEHVMPVVREMDHLRQRALLNGHFKNIVPPKIN
jgi:ATP-dependent Lon protease